METSSRPDLIVHHWRYEDGKPREQFSPIPKGWYCWVYERSANSNQNSVEDWFADNMTGKYECDFRFNGGNPMHTVYIRNKKDAMFFALNFVNV